MPTTLPIRALPPAVRRTPVLAIAFLLAFFAAIVAIETIDPAPMDVLAGEVAAP